MTLQTPLHLQCFGLKQDRHLVDATVTGRTSDAFFHVNTVIEVSEIRQVVNSDPLNRLAGAETLAYGFKIWTIGPDLFVTVHARRRGRKTGGRRSFH